MSLFQIEWHHHISIYRITTMALILINSLCFYLLLFTLACSLTSHHFTTFNPKYSGDNFPFLCLSPFFLCQPLSTWICLLFICIYMSMYIYTCSRQFCGNAGMRNLVSAKMPMGSKPRAYPPPYALLLLLHFLLLRRCS